MDSASECQVREMIMKTERTFLETELKRSLKIRTMSALSLFTMVLCFLSHSTGTVYLPAWSSKQIQKVQGIKGCETMSPWR